MGWFDWLFGASQLLDEDSISGIKRVVSEDIKIEDLRKITSFEDLASFVTAHRLSISNVVFALSDADKTKYKQQILDMVEDIAKKQLGTKYQVLEKTLGAFQGALSSTSAQLPHGGAVSSTSPVPVSTVRPPGPQTGGFTYTRNRYQQYEDKIKSLTGGADNKPEEGPAEQAEQAKQANPAELAKQAAEVSKEIEKATADLVAALDIKPEPAEPKPAQSGGMELDNIDREISNIRNFLLSTKNAQNAQTAQNQSGGSYLLSDIAGSDAMDLNLKAIRDNLLNANYSATSDMGMNMAGGANFSATSSDMAFGHNGNQLGGNLSATSSDMAFNNISGQAAQLGGNLSATSPFSDLAQNQNQNQDLVGGSNLNYSITSDVPVNYDMLMGGAKNGKNDKKNENVKKEKNSSSTHSSSCSTSEEDSDKSTSTDHKSSSDTDSTPSGTEIGIDASDFVGSSDADLNASDLKRLQRGIDKRQNRSNFLRGDYVLTSNSDKNYAVNGRPYFSSQSSEYQNGVASEFLKNMRTRSRA